MCFIVMTSSIKGAKVFGLIYNGKKHTRYKYIIWKTDGHLVTTHSFIKSLAANYLWSKCQGQGQGQDNSLASFRGGS